tara:strand:- start:5454 stop:5612 length:159 start_codon:yes stop_codon:yes gene_type:complete
LGQQAPVFGPIGPKRGNSFLGFFTAGDVLTSEMEGADLFLKKYAKFLNYADA